MMHTLIEIVLKATVLLALAPLVAQATRRWSSAATRHYLYLLGLGGALLLPLAIVLLHPYQAAVPLLPRPVVVAPRLLPLAQTPAPALPAPLALPAVASGQAPAGLPPATTPTRTAPAPRVPWLAVLLGVYFAGAAALLARMMAGFVGLRRLGTLCTPVPDDHPLRREADVALRTLGILRVVGLRVATTSSGNTLATPMTWGVFRPIIALPADAADWPIERLRAALLHEAAHVRRGDFGTQSLLARAVVAVYWFHPLAWLAARQLRVESECACDDHVLTTGRVAGADYARHLLEVARAARPVGIVGSLSSAAVAMAQSPRIEPRLRAALNPRLNRREAKAGLRFAAFVAATGTVGAEALLRLVTASAMPPVAAGDAAATPTITLPNGVTFHLIGIDAPKVSANKVNGWWDARGKKIADNPIPHNVLTYGLPVTPRQFSLRRFAVITTYDQASQPQDEWVSAPDERSRVLPVLGSDANRYSWPTKSTINVNVKPHEGAWQMIGTNGDWDIRRGAQRSWGELLIASFSSGARNADLNLGAAAGPWTDVVTFPVQTGHTVVPTRLGKAGFDLTLGTGAIRQGKAQIRLYTPFIPGVFDERLLAVDRQGRIVYDLDAQRGGKPWSDGYGILRTLPANLLPRIAAFRLLVRPYRTATFYNLPLQPTQTAPDKPAATAGAEETGDPTPRTIDAPSPTAAVTLPNGAIVGLNGIHGQVQRGASQWWQADGQSTTADMSRLPVNIPAKLLTGQKDRSFSATAKYDDTAQPRFVYAGEGYPSGGSLYASGQPVGSKNYYFDLDTFCVIDPETRETGTTPPPPPSLPVPPSTNQSVQIGSSHTFPKKAQRVTVRVVVAAGPWTEVIRCPFKPGRIDVHSRDDSRGGVHFGVDLHPRDIGSNKAYVDAYDHFPAYSERRLIAVNREGRLIADFAPWGVSPEGEGPGPWQGTVRFETRGYVPNALLPRIAELRLLIRPYQTATFHHVALEPAAQPTQPVTSSVSSPTAR